MTTKFFFPSFFFFFILEVCFFAVFFFFPSFVGRRSLFAHHDHQSAVLADVSDSALYFQQLLGAAQVGCPFLSDILVGASLAFFFSSSLSSLLSSQ